MMHQVLAMIQKELRDALRDKRSILAGMSYALIMPIIMSLSFAVMISDLKDQKDIEISIEGAEYAADLIRHLASSDIVHSDDSNSRLSIILTIPEEYPEQMAQGEPAEIILTADRSDKGLRSAFSQVRSSIRRYSSEMASLRLIARGISPLISKPVTITVHDLATRESKAGVILGGLLLTLMLSVFISGLNLAMDTSAGERERNSLGLLLSQPVTTWQILMAKTVAVVCFSLFGFLMTIVVSLIAYDRVPWHELGFSVDLSLTTAALIFLFTVPIAFLAATLQLYFSFFAKSFKEAQSYMTIVLFVPIGLVMASGFDVLPDVLKWMPVSGQQLAITEMIKGQPIPVIELVISSLVTLLFAVAFGAASSYALKREKVIFGL